MRKLVNVDPDTKNSPLNIDNLTESYTGCFGVKVASKWGYIGVGGGKFVYFSNGNNVAATYSDKFTNRSLIQEIKKLVKDCGLEAYWFETIGELCQWMGEK